ncbi:hypothetical protein CYCD_22210 [Tenuifilaceae bacterium CYCD]|nr:hypothetical protein CYCD_22210 [Tenuifilaceae bacterium CYCD]
MKRIISLAVLLLMGLNTFSQIQNTNRNKILIVLDIQKQFTTTTLSDSSANSLIASTNLIINQFKPENVVYIQSIARVLNVSLKGFRVDTLPDLELDQRLNIVNKNIITKNKADAFSAENLNKFIEKSGLKDIVVIGLMAEHCVKATLLGGKKKGYSMYYVPEAIAAKTPKGKIKTENKLLKANVKSIPLNNILNSNGTEK